MLRCDEFSLSPILDIYLKMRDYYRRRLLSLSTPSFMLSYCRSVMLPRRFSSLLLFDDDADDICNLLRRHLAK